MRDFGASICHDFRERLAAYRAAYSLLDAGGMKRDHLSSFEEAKPSADCGFSWPTCIELKDHGGGGRKRGQ